MNSRRHFFTIECLIFFLAIFVVKVDSKEINLASFELEPYVGVNLEHEGAISEIVSAAFAISSNKIKIAYFPAARARTASKSQMYLGVFPVLENTVSSNDFILSDPLPGIQLALLKKKNNVTFESYDGKKIGVLRGTFLKIAQPKFNNAIIVEINSNKQLLKMLDAGRLDYVFIDKFTASDLMVNILPYLIGQFEFVSNSHDYVSFHLAIYKTNNLEAEQVLNTFNRGLKQISAAGLVDKILYKHGLLSFVNKHDKNTIRIATVDNKEFLMMKKLSHLYKAKHPNIKLEWHVLDESVLRLRLMSDLAIGGGQYDIMTIGSYESALWAKNGWLHPINNLTEEYNLTDIIHSVKDSLSYKNTLYALPFYAESSMTYYRKDLFNKAKITMPSRPTWSQIYAMADQLKQEKNGAYSICLRAKPSWGESIALITTIVNSFGGQWFDENWQPKLTSKEWRQAVSFYIKLMQEYGPPNAHTLGYKENLKLFSQGKCAIWVDATVAAGTLYNPKMSTVSDNVGFAAAPYEMTNKGSNWLWSWALAIPVSSHSYDNALDFIVWATSKDYLDDVAKFDGWTSIPPGTRYSTYQNSKYNNEAPFSNFVFNAIISANTKDATLTKSPYQGIQYVDIPEFPAIGNYVGKQISNVLTKEKSLVEALIDSQGFAELQMKLSKKNRD